jgi:hypothetical protein
MPCWLLLITVLLAVPACESPGDAAKLAQPVMSAQSQPVAPGDMVLAPPLQVPNNPLQLPYPSEMGVSKGDRVYAVSRASLRVAGLGKTLVLRLSRVVGHEGEQLLVRQPSGVPYAIHPAYVVAMRHGRFRRRGSVLAPRDGRMRHAVVRTFRRKKVVVKYTDVGLHLREQALDRGQLGILAGGLEAGGFAVLRDGDVLRHVTLISKGTHKDGKLRWLALAYGAVATLIDHERLAALPRLPRLRPGADVLVAWRGTMTAAVVGKVEASGLLSLKRPRFGGLLTAGPGMVMLR